MSVERKEPAHQTVPVIYLSRHQRIPIIYEEALADQGPRVRTLYAGALP